MSSLEANELMDNVVKLGHSMWMDASEDSNSLIRREVNVVELIRPFAIVHLLSVSCLSRKIPFNVQIFKRRWL